ncbi:MAG: sigma-70 family RNA polymerase sigma factor [Elusimicrobiota bacterium]|jgi:RNA polymerase sigma-70 factor (ECF subfamily)
MGSERYERFVREYGEQAFRIAYHLSGNVEEAKDLVQESFCRLLRTWERYDGGRSLEGWFSTILKNLFLDERKRYERRNVHSLDRAVEEDDCEAPSRGGDAFPDGEEPILEALSRRETAQTVREALQSLRGEYRSVLALCDVEGMSYEGIARTLEMPVGTVRSRVSRARDALKAELSRRLEEVAR